MAQPALQALPERIVVVGMSGSGKTTLAAHLARATGAACIELDNLFWGPGWEPRAGFREDVRQAVSGERWVVDGNYSILRDVIWPRAQLVVWLDLPFHTVFRQVFRRTMHRVWHRVDLWHGNRESLRRTFFTRDSILWWVISQFRRRRKQLSQLRADGKYPHLEWVHLRTSREVGAFMARHGLSDETGGAQQRARAEQPQDVDARAPHDQGRGQ